MGKHVSNSECELFRVGRILERHGDENRYIVIKVLWDTHTYICQKIDKYGIQHPPEEISHVEFLNGNFRPDYEVENEKLIADHIKANKND